MNKEILSNSSCKILMVIVIVNFFLQNHLLSQITFQRKGSVSSGGGSFGTQTSDGGFIFFGSTSAYGAGNGDLYLIKTDGKGDTTWARTFGGTNNEDISDYSFIKVSNVEQTKDGGYIACGCTNSFGAGGYDVYVVKTDGNGNLQWSKTIGGNADDYGNYIKQTIDGGYIITGHSDNTLLNEIYLVKLTGSGNVQWAKTYGDGTYPYYGFSCEQTHDGGYIVAGKYNIQSSSAAVVMKSDSLGNILWSKKYTEELGSDFICIQQTDDDADGVKDDGYVMVGRTLYFQLPTGNNYDVFLVKTDGSGNLTWSKRYGGSTTSHVRFDYGRYVQQTADGGYILTGETNSFSSKTERYLLKTNGSGTISWGKSYNDGVNWTGYGYSVRQTSDGGYVSCGSSAGSYTIKTDVNGNSGCNENNISMVINLSNTTAANYFAASRK